MKLEIIHEVTKDGGVHMMLLKDGKEDTNCYMKSDKNNSYESGVGLMAISVQALLRAASPFKKKKKVAKHGQ
jgi:hypothetical protein